MSGNIIPWSISALSLLFVILTFVRNGNKDRKREIKDDDLQMNSIQKSLLAMNLKLDQLCDTTIEIKADIKSLNKDFSNLDRRLTIVETDLKTAFNQLEELKSKIS